MAKAKIVKMVSFNKVKNVQKGPNLIEFKPWKSVIPTISSPMITAFGGKDIPGNRLSIGFAHIAKADEIGGPTHHHPHDQWIAMFGTSDNFVDFDADVEFTLGKKVYKINYPFYAFIPAGMPHCPLSVKRLGKPIIFMDARLPEDKGEKPAVKKPALKKAAAIKK